MKTAIFLSVLLTGSVLLPQTGAQPKTMKEKDSNLKLQILGAKIKVADMDLAIDFYSNVIGYEIESKDTYPNGVLLKDAEMMLVLEKTDKIRKINYPNESQTILVFQTNNLDKRYEVLKSKGVKFYYEDHQKVGVGRSNKFYDPFGNMHSLLEERIVDVPEFREPRIYNVGYYIPDMEKGRQFYSILLGLPIRSLRYYPPALPLNDFEGNFSTILHLRKDMVPVSIDYNNETFVATMFSTPDLPGLITYLKSKNVKFVFENPRSSELGIYIALTDPFGNHLEIYQL